MIIENGTGNGNKLAINGRNEATVFGVIETEDQAAADLGDAYNINTGDIALTGAATLLYLYNDEDQDIVINAIAVGIRGSTVADMATVTLTSGPTGGDLISDATAVTSKANRNFGSSKLLKATTLAYKGKTGGTVTGGIDVAQFYMGNNSRLFASIDIELPRGSSLSLKVTGTATAGNAYAALVCHVKDALR